ncbi:MAG: GyrI-like domain-containing protein [Alkalibacterium sp.]|uniref:GyrI-like domain-containing protein n=1 Tax=Alkalibacterium sp. TaxID=1872447 RepID=UPI0039706520
MDYRIVEKDPIKLIAKVEQFPNETITDQENTENTIPEFWQRSMASDVMEVLREHSATADMYGVCAPISTDRDYFDYGIGMLHDGSEVPQGYRVWELTSRLWAVFPCIGDDPTCISDTWDKISTEFKRDADYRIVDETDFEFYEEGKPGELFCEIWIPVEKKSE